MLRQLKQVGVPLQKKLKVLDVGCGRGVLGAQVEGFSNWTIDGADLNLDALSKAKPGRGKKLLYNVCEEREPFIEAYDIVILFDVLEHINNTRPFLSSVLRHIKPGGLLLLNVPALRAFFSAYDKLVGHMRRYNKKTLAEEFNGFNLEIVDMRYWGLTMVALLAIRKLMMSAVRPNTQTVKWGFDPRSTFVHNVLRGMMHAETAAFSKAPVGSSLLMVGAKL